MHIRRGEIGLFVSDLGRATGFYMATLGFRRIPDPLFGESDGTWEKMQSGEVVITLFQARTAQPAPAPGLQSGMTCDIIVENIGDLVKRLKAAGASVGEIREWPGGKVVEFVDLDGIGWSLIEESRR